MKEMLDISLAYGDLRAKSLAQAVSDHALVRSLDLSGNNISVDQLREIVDDHVCRMINMEEIDLKDNKIGPRGAEHLCKVLMQHCPKLRYLDLNENGILDESMLHVAYLLRESCIESLFLVSNHLSPRGIPTLCDGVLSSRHIRSLALAFNVLGDAGASIIAKAFANHPTLELLDISDNRISDTGAIDIAENLILSANSRLESLNLSVNCIGDIGFTAIADAVAQSRNTRLNHLDLGGNMGVGPIGRGALIKQARFMRHLNSLDLCSCNLSDEDARNLLAAVSCSSCGITLIEWFNNPEIMPVTEKALYDALQVKKSRPPNTERDWHWFALFGGVLCGAALIVGAMALRRTRR